MSLPPDQLPQNVEQLSRMVLVRDARIADLQEEVASLKRLIHSARSEMLSTIDPAQASFYLGDLSTVSVAANDDRRDAGEQGPRCKPPAARYIGFLPKHLPRYDVVIEPESHTCSCC